MKRRIWTREELILAFNLYLKLPFGKMHKGNPKIIQLSELINRTPSSVAMRLTNYASIDPYHQARGISGLTGGAKQCQPIWDEFNSCKEEFIFESEQVLAEVENNTIEIKYSKILENIDHYVGKEKIRKVKTRVNQNVFRQIVLNSYSTKCAICGIDIPELLNASHIVPWALNKDERLNPENGICLSKLYDAAFDKGFIGIRNDYSIILSSKIKKKENKSYYNKYFLFLENLKIALPERFLPKKEFLEFHIDTIFQG